MGAAYESPNIRRSAIVPWRIYSLGRREAQAMAASHVNDSKHWRERTAEK